MQVRLGTVWSHHRGMRMMFHVEHLSICPTVGHYYQTRFYNQGLPAKWQWYRDHRCNSNCRSPRRYIGRQRKLNRFPLKSRLSGAQAPHNKDIYNAEGISKIVSRLSAVIGSIRDFRFSNVFKIMGLPRGGGLLSLI